MTIGSALRSPLNSQPNRIIKIKDIGLTAVSKLNLSACAIAALPMQMFFILEAMVLKKFKTKLTKKKQPKN